MHLTRTVEFEPAVMDYLQQIGGPRVVERYKTERTNGMAASLGGMLKWHRLTPEERRDQRATVPPWWALPTKNTLDRATAMLPKLLYGRLDDMGLDVTVVYPTFGLLVPHLDDEEIRRAACRAFNAYHADVFREYYEKHPLSLAVVIALTVGSSLLGLVLTGWVGVAVGLLIGLIAFLIGPASTKVREIHKGS